MLYSDFLTRFDLTPFDAFDSSPPYINTEEVGFEITSIYTISVDLSVPISLESASQYFVLKPGDAYEELVFEVESQFNLSNDYNYLVPVNLESQSSFGCIVDQNWPVMDFESEADILMTPPKITWDLDNYKWISASVRKSATSPVGNLEISFDGDILPPDDTNVDIIVSDHNEIPRILFSGKLFDKSYTTVAGRRHARATGYEYTLLLTKQSLSGQDFSYPSEWWNMSAIVSTQLSGEDHQWWNVTGIRPYKIYSPESWGHDYVEKDFVFSANSSKMDAIQEMGDYGKMIFLTKPQIGDSPNGYFVHVDDVDHMVAGLDLPDPVYFINPDDYVVEVKIEERRSEGINRIIVRGCNAVGAWFKAVKEHPRVTSGEEFPIELYEESSDWSDGTKVQDRADYLYNTYIKEAVTITATLVDRVDLELFQLVRFVGFSGIPNVDLRIISISYEIQVASVRVSITATSNTDVASILGIERSQDVNTVSEVEHIAKKAVGKAVKEPEVGTAITVGESEAEIELERGDTVRVRVL